MPLEIQVFDPSQDFLVAYKVSVEFAFSERGTCAPAWSYWGSTPTSTGAPSSTVSDPDIINTSPADETSDEDSEPDYAGNSSSLYSDNMLTVIIVSSILGCMFGCAVTVGCLSAAFGGGTPASKPWSLKLTRDKLSKPLLGRLERLKKLNWRKLLRRRMKSRWGTKRLEHWLCELCVDWDTE